MRSFLWSRFLALMSYFCVKDAMPCGQGVFKSENLKFIASTAIIKLHLFRRTLQCNYTVKIQVTMEYFGTVSVSVFFCFCD